MPVKLPLLSATAPDAPIAWRRNQPIGRAAFLRHVGAVARRLPPARFIFNLCEDRYLFLVAFAAVGANGQTGLLPSSRAHLHLRDLTEDYPDNYSLTDGDVESWLAPEAMDGDAMPAVPVLPADQVMAIAFTSGSTGRAKPHPKRWGELVSGACQARQRFGFEPGMTVVATVPAQHMYGLETTIMTRWPVVPVSTPVGRFPRGRARGPGIGAVAASAGDHSRPPARLRPGRIALAGNGNFDFGHRAAGGNACRASRNHVRRTSVGNLWLHRSGFHCQPSHPGRRALAAVRRFSLRDGALSGAHLLEPVPLSDELEPCDKAEFRLLGRIEDLVNIAGKRTSLGYLNHHLNQIAGVIEGMFWLPDDTGSEVQRLVAAAVAPDLSERQILVALAERLDPVFLPRPLLKVDRLPRNETGKVTRDALRALGSAATVRRGRS